MAKITFLLVFLGITNVWSLTVSEMYLEIRRNIKDTSTDINYQKWSNTELLQRINIFQEDIAVKTFCVSTITFITTSGGTREYYYPSDFLALKQVSYLINGSTFYRKIDYRSVSENNLNRPQWENDATGGNPLTWFDRCDMFGLDMVPSSTYAGTNKVRLEYYCRPVDLVNDSDIPFNGVISLYPFHQLICWGVSALCLVNEEDNAATYFEQKYSIGLQQLYSILSNIPAHTGGRIQPLIK